MLGSVTELGVPRGIHAPDKGCVVGLDISVRSTGVAIVGRQPTIAKFSGKRAESGTIKSTFGGSEKGIPRSTFGGAEDGVPQEEENPANALRLAVTNETLSAEAGIRRRLEFKQYLKEALSGIPVAVVVVEDVFAGVNITSYRELLNLNNVVDELILEGVITTAAGEEPELVRVQSRVWKRWIRRFVKETPNSVVHEHAKYLSDKRVVRESLTAIGVPPETLEGGKGNQDRCDAAGMALGWLLRDVEDLESPIPEAEEPKVSDAEVEEPKSADTSQEEGTPAGEENTLSVDVWWGVDEPPKAGYSQRERYELSATELSRAVGQGFDKVGEFFCSYILGDPAAVYVVRNASVGNYGRRLGLRPMPRLGGCDLWFTAAE